MRHISEIIPEAIGQINNSIEVNKIYNEPCLETLYKVPDNFLDCVITSPPYWQLRDYGYAGQWGLEPTYNEYLEHLWQMMDQIYRCLKPEGTCWINLGDSYSGSQMTGGNGKERAYGSQMAKKALRYDELPSKCLMLIPHRFAIGCIERGWIMRNDCIWAKRNGMPESVTDRFSKKHEYFFFMVKSEKYYFDLDAIRDKHKEQSIARVMQNNGNPKFNGNKERCHVNGSDTLNPNQFLNDGGKNPGSVADFWDVPTKPSSSEHYASYNDFLLKKPVLSGCPVGGIIYDPFMGTGSTAEVALRSDRKFIGSEMSSDYVAIAEKRLNPFLQQTQLF
jgi:DNA modification methylase